MSYDMLQVASIGLELFNLSNKHKQNWASYYESQDTANRQYAANNALYYSTALHINEEKMLAAESHSMDITQLYRQIRSSKATAKVRIESQGGDHTLGSGAARMRNISNQGSEALMRKDQNFQITLNDFRARHRNNEINTLNKNNKAFSGLLDAPDATGLALQGLGLGINKYAEVGYRKNNKGEMVSRWNSDA